MEVVCKLCPKCNGKGKKRYKMWSSDTIVQNLVVLKKEDSPSLMHPSTCHLEIQCPLCEGKRKIDWLDEALNSHIKPYFEKLEGNMDVYLAKTGPEWIMKRQETHKISFCRNDKRFYTNLENLVSCSQECYETIKLNDSVLKMSLYNLKQLVRKIQNYNVNRMVAPDEIKNEEDVIMQMKYFGLSDFLPDKFAYPGPDDYPK